MKMIRRVYSVVGIAVVMLAVMAVTASCGGGGLEKAVKKAFIDGDTTQASYDKICALIKENPKSYADFVTESGDINIEALGKYINEVGSSLRPPMTWDITGYGLKELTLTVYFERSGSMTPYDTPGGGGQLKKAVNDLINFFPSKDDLFKSVLLRISQLRIASVEQALPELLADPWKGLRTVCHFWLDHHLRHGDFLHVAHSLRLGPHGSFLAPDDPVEKRLRANGETYRALLSRYFTALAATPEARPIDPAILFTAFEGYIRTSLFAFSRAHGGADKGDISALEENVHQALCILFRK